MWKAWKGQVVPDKVWLCEDGLTASLFVPLGRFSQGSLHPAEIYLWFLSPPASQTHNIIIINIHIYTNKYDCHFSHFKNIFN